MFSLSFLGKSRHQQLVALFNDYMSYYFDLNHFLLRKIKLLYVSINNNESLLCSYKRQLIH